VFNFEEDWAKIVHLESTKFFVCGGSGKKDNNLIVFSNKAFIVDVEDGQVIRLPDMIK